jgi:hypothetical protein
VDTLTLIAESKIHRLLPGSDPDSRLEASGLIALQDRLIIVFDNLSQAAIIDASLALGAGNRWIGEKNGPTGFEDITYDDIDRRYFVLIEAVPGSGSSFQAKVIEYDDAFNRRGSHRLPFDFDRANKGFEGLTYVRRNGHFFLLALCEGNHCKGGSAGREPGGGRIQVFQKAGDGWEHVDSLKMPPTVQFVDHASLDIRDGRVAVLSQECAQLWIGTLHPARWDVVDEGVVHALPTDEQGETIYCYAEGVTCMTPDRVAVVSDRKKQGDPKRCAEQDQSVHIFRIP